ncbi:Alpha/Beta hydrolase protein [Gorgonomyces haynaldii]|nr:Alpha/Beta hydrolase protein [Gorgonomyces haynaldii]
MLPLFLGVTAYPQTYSVGLPSDVLSLANTVIRLETLSSCNATILDKRACTLCNDPAISTLTDLTGRTIGDMQFFSAYRTTADQIVVGFRGSANFQNWVTNLDAFGQGDLTIGSTKAKVHDGWYSSTLKILDQLGQDITSLYQKHPGATFMFVGHSAGAAYTSFSALLGLQPNGFLQKLNVPASNVTIFTSAGPRMGDQNFVKIFQSTGFKTVYRIAKSADVVTLMPPEFLNYKHYDKEIFINSYQNADQTPVFCDQQPSSTQKGSCSKRIAWAELLAQPGKIADQHLNYLGIKIQC